MHWRWVAGENWETVRPDPVVDEFVAPAGEPCWLATVEEWPSTSRLDDGTVIVTRMMPTTYANEIVEMDAAAALHVALHDPAAVLRQVAAHRAILKLHEVHHEPERWGVDRVITDRTQGPYGSPTGGFVYWCAVCNGDRDYGYIAGPEEGCATLRSVAAIYSDRPGYVEEWKP